jgi:hypothetical protein
MSPVSRRAALGTVAAAPAFLRAQSKSEPNLLLMPDQHRAYWMGCDGNQRAAGTQHEQPHWLAITV